MEIEFRFFRKDPTPKMIYPECDFLVNHLGVPMGVVRYPKNKVEVREMDVIPLMYTGLKDKNGRKIYNGDIIKRNGHIRTVIFRDGAFGLSGIKQFDGSMDIFHIWHHGHALYNFISELEVIGNRYENPELLKK